MRVKNVWALFQGVSASLVIAAALVAMQPYLPICSICENPDGGAAWWMCLFCF